jgi:hypothetical protein
MKTIPPSPDRNSFNCPHCGALAHQDWYLCRAKAYEEGKLPTFWTAKNEDETIKNIEKDSNLDAETKELWKTNVREAIAGYVTIATQAANDYDRWLENLNLSVCYSCGRVAVWVHTKLVEPTAHGAPPANEDIPAHIKPDYEEAAKIYQSSPRGAAALLRLVIQKITIHLGEPGENLNNDISSLVKKGLSPRIQKALDAVRVIGNHAVHPGRIDIKDDLSTALSLFGLVNAVVDGTISRDARIDEAYELIPENLRKEIEKRDKK